MHIFYRVSCQQQKNIWDFPKILHGLERDHSWPLCEGFGVFFSGFLGVSSELDCILFLCSQGWSLIWLTSVCKEAAMCPRIWDKDQEITVSLHKEPRGCMQQLRRRVTGDGCVLIRLRGLSTCTGLGPCAERRPLVDPAVAESGAGVAPERRGLLGLTPYFTFGFKRKCQEKQQRGKSKIEKR